MDIRRKTALILDLESIGNIKKLEEYENKQKNDFLIEQLNEINSIEGTSFTAINQLPQETIDMFGKLGNLKQAYFATQGEKLLAKQLNGTTTHLSNKNKFSINFV